MLNMKEGALQSRRDRYLKVPRVHILVAISQTDYETDNLGSKWSG